MTKYRFALFFTLILLCTFVRAEDLKVAIVDLEKAVGEAEAVKAINSKLDSEFAGERKELKSLREKLDKLEKTQKQEAKRMSEKEAEKLDKEVRRSRMQYGYFFEAVSEKADQRHEELMEKINPLVKQAVKEVVESGSYDIVHQRESVLHFNPKLDISNKLTEKINELANKAQ